MKLSKPVLIMLLLLLFIPIRCGSRGDPSTPTRVVETLPTVKVFTQVEQRSTATAIPTAKYGVKTIPPTMTITYRTITSSPTPTATETFNLPKGRYLVTAEVGDEGQNASIVRYYDEKNSLVRELTIQRRVIEISTSGDGRFLSYYGDGTWVGSSFKPYDGIYIYDTASGQEWALDDYQHCTGPGDWSPEPYRLAISCGEIKIISFDNNQWVEEGIISLLDEYDQMPTELRPLLVAPAWSPDGKSIAYLQDNSSNLPGGASGPYITDAACITKPGGCKAITKVFKEAVDPTSVLSWSVDGAALYIANGKVEDIIALRTGNGKSNQILDTDERIYHMDWSQDNHCFWFSRAIGSFRRQSIYKYCLNFDAAEEEIIGAGYLVGFVDIN